MKIGKETICLLQYADDTVIFLDGSEKSLMSALDLIFQSVQTKNQSSLKVKLYGLDKKLIVKINFVRNLC